MPPAMQYCLDVVEGRIRAGKWVRLACRRHLEDLEKGPGRGLYFDEEAARHVIEFFGFLKHSKGEWAGQGFDLEPWQQFYLWCKYGWMKEGGGRRFNTSHLEIARKNGKTTLAAGEALYLLFADGEMGAEVYSVATKKDQARICFEEAKRMVRASPFLSKYLGVFKHNIHCEATAGKFEPLGRDYDSLDGLNVHAAVCDELHAWKYRDLYEVIDTATGARTSPMISAITTAGTDRKGICYENRLYLQKVLEGVVRDDSWFGMIYTIDEGDDWEDETVWLKANPNLGVSCKLADLRRKARKARSTPAALNGFLTKHLNVWCQAESRWIGVDAWRACGEQPVDPEALKGRACYGGLDLATTTDIAAWVLVFPPESDDEPYWVLPRFFVPADNIARRSRRDRVPYETWEREGFITATPGNVIDYAFILAQMERDAEQYDLKELAFDRWGAPPLYAAFEDLGFTAVRFGQGYASMSPPAKELEKLILERRLAHGGNPVLAWMADNVVVSMDPAGNIKPDKKKSTEKIDGIVALIMALDRALRQEGEEISAYESEGLLIL